jgi:hypothetical protein
MRALFAVTSLSLFVAGCSGTTASPTGPTTTGSTGSTTSSAGGTGGSTATSTSSTGSGGVGFDAGGPITTYTTGEGPISLMPGEEETNCITIHLGNTQGGYVRRVIADLEPGSHHMIVYKSSDTTESPTPTPCYGLQGILQGQHPFFIAQQAHAELDWPDDESGHPVGFEIEPNQMVHIEFHTINTTQAPIMVTGKALIDTIPVDTPNVVPSDLAFWGTKNIHIPPMSSFDTGVQYQYGIPGTKSFAVTTHQHHLGTQMQVWYASSETDTSDRIANGLSWSDPPLDLLNPPIDFPADGTKLLTYDCHWENPTTNEVNFGESFNDEMCFVWHYYYPSQGFQACIDHLCATSM